VPSVDVIVVSFRSHAHLRAAVDPLSRLDDVQVVVVDNASDDGSLDTVRDLPVTAIQRPSNGGFAVGCNVGWRHGVNPYVLFLNPDATIDELSLRRLVAVLDENERAGAAAPRIEHADGSPAFSLRRFPRLTSTFSQALFVHRLFPRAPWSDEVIRDPDAYARPWSPEWVSGACLLVRRTALELLDGWDEGFFLYSEDTDLCARLRARGLDVRFEPAAHAVHLEGASAPHGATLPLLAAARIRYARKHRGPATAALDRLGVALGALTHAIAGRGGPAARQGHLQALLFALGLRAPLAPGGNRREMVDR
jgi:N-acetylglucosaminyl-diphospho-decaprenol L-rhamnosyltransferase